jgi:hypothetical protein
MLSQITGQVDLINCEAYADGEFKYIMNYQDHFTKFVHLYPLKTKTAAEVAWHLLEIFLTFGAPAILQLDNGKEFVASVITELKQLWPDLKIVQDHVILNHKVALKDQMVK